MAEAMQVTHAHVCHVTGFAAWRDAARSYVAADVAPDAIEWMDAHAQDATQSLFADAPTSLPPAVSDRTLSLPGAMLRQLRLAACFRADDRWAFLYRVLWRWAHSDHSVMSSADPDGARLHGMVRAVGREIHHMHAYVRFRERPHEADGPRYVAWFEPAHDVLHEAADHFVQRMGQAGWLIATPQATLVWDGVRLHEGPGVARADVLLQEDACEILWLAYYRNTFNPSRVNVSLMRSHMPVRFWHNLPEAPLIREMTVAADTGARRMGQSRDVEEKVRSGNASVVSISPDRAQPQRPTAHALDACRRCDLWRDATHGVPGVGPAHAKIIVLGEQPGDHEDLRGVPFVGPAGEILDQAFAASGLSRAEVYLTNAVKHFKWELRGKRRLHKTPGQQEIIACHHWLEQELVTIGSKIVVSLGATALKSLLRSGKVTLGQFTEQVIEHAGLSIVPTYHPSHVLRLSTGQERTQALQHIVEALRRAHELSRAASRQDQ